MATTNRSTRADPHRSPARLPSRPATAAEILRAAAIYFALVFGAGFVLGTGRVLWAVPHFGERIAELLEQPLMLVAIVLAARWTVRHFVVARVPSVGMGIGLVALAFLITAELGVVAWVRGLSVSAYVEGRDPVSGTVYLVMLGLFALMPWLAARW